MTRRTLLWGLGVLLGGLGLVLLGRFLLWWQIRAQAEAHGVQLEGCGLEIRWQRVGLAGCRFALVSAASGQSSRWALGSARVGGRVEQADVFLAGLALERLRVRGADVDVRGTVRWLDLLRSLVQEPAAPDLPIVVEASRLTWIAGEDPEPWLTLSELGYDSRDRKLGAQLALRSGMQGALSLGQPGLQVRLGDPERPRLRLSVRAGAQGARLEASADVRALPLRDLEGAWLVLPDLLRSVELTGTVFVALPIGLRSELPGGDVHLTLAGLQWPVPRELEGLVYATAPKLSGKFALTRGLDRATFRELEFLSGALSMRGEARVGWVGSGFDIEANLSGPLSCVAIAESAARAHAGSPLAAWAERAARRTLRGSVQVVAALRGHTSDLPSARVVTSVGVGCGLRPLPIEADLPRELWERLPEEIRQRLPRVEDLPALPPLPAPDRVLPGTLPLPTLPTLKPAGSRARERSANG